MAESAETTGLSLDAQRDAQDQADYLMVPQVIWWVAWIIGLIVFVDWLANKVRPH